MKIGGRMPYLFLGICTASICVFICVITESDLARTLSSVAGAVISIVMFLGMNWYYNNMADGQRALTSQRSNLSNGIDRVINIYTADGNIIAKYEGKIDIEANDGCYIIFDFEGKRYMYYNCFVESIGVIP